MSVERLTKRTVAGTANIDYEECFFSDGKVDNIAKSARRQLAIDRLAAYEDTGLTPEEIKSLRAEWAVNLKVLESYRTKEAAAHDPK